MSEKEDSKTKIIVVTSGKGGVGKTTTSAAVATGLALKGFKTAVIDFDIGLRNLDLIMGCERRVVFDFINVINGEATLNQALIRDKKTENLYILAASQTRDKDALTTEGVERVIKELSYPEKKTVKEDTQEKESEEDTPDTKNLCFDYIVCDSPAGIESGALKALYFADEALVVTNPEVSSVRDSDRILGILDSRTKRIVENLEPVKKHLIITRYSPRRVAEDEMLSTDDICDILGIEVPLLGVIPESETVLQASNTGLPIILDQESQAGLAYSDLIDRYLRKEGEDEIPHRFLEVEKKGFFSKMFGG